MARPASPEATVCARIWAVDRGTGASQRPGSLPAPRVTCHYSPVGFDRQQYVYHIYTFFLLWLALLLIIMHNSLDLFDPKFDHSSYSKKIMQKILLLLLWLALLIKVF